MEDAVWSQIDNVLAVPGVERMAVMPDAHVGNGACVGTAILTRDVIIPACVGVDIGCGMIAAPLLDIPRSMLGDLPHLRSLIEQLVPIGRTHDGQPGDRGAWGVPPDDVQNVWADALESNYRRMVDKYPALAHPQVVNHLGTLGTGNHFIEVCIELGIPDPSTGPDRVDPRVWVMLHSGSRGVGNRIGQFFTRRAQNEMKRWHVELADPELAFLPAGTELFNDYLRCVNWAQQYAWESRLLMFEAVRTALIMLLNENVTWDENQLVHAYHNYVAQERHFGKPGFLTRKGAINAEKGRMGIIPGSMGARSYVTRGLGNTEALMTSSHGAGRVMSRNMARKTITFEDHLAAVQGVECRTDVDVLDESPAAYKDLDAVMGAQRDLTEPVYALKQIVCVKG